MQDPLPSAAYDGADTPEEIKAACQRAHYATLAKHGVDTPGDLPSEVADFLGEDLRRAWCRHYRDNRPKTETYTEGGVRLTRPRVTRDLPLTVCTSCGEEKPVNKFPTISGKPGVRENVCRYCKKARVTTRAGAQ